MLALIGLIIIVLAWMIQLVVLIKDKKSRKIHNCFVISYIIGALILVYDGFTGGVASLAIANLLTVMIAGLVLFIIRNRK